MRSKLKKRSLALLIALACLLVLACAILTQGNTPRTTEGTTYDFECLTEPNKNPLKACAH